ncbi:MAG: hypothetical protein RIR70_2196 [Pseudomonadota bacterium]|jgi:hypothetical protein
MKSAARNVIRQRTFFLGALFAGLLIGALVSQFNLFRANLWLENLTSPLSFWLRGKDCLKLPGALKQDCLATQARAVPPELVAAAQAIEQEQELMRQAWLAVNFPPATFVTYYRLIDTPDISHRSRAGAPQTIFLPRQEDESYDEGIERTPVLRMTRMVPIAAMD